MQRGERAHAAVSGGQRVTDRDPHARGRQIGIADDAAPAAHRLANAAESRPRRIGTRLAVTRHAHDDQPGVGLAEFGRVEVPFLERAGAEILDQYVGLGDQLARQLLTVFTSQVDGDRIFVARDHAPPAGFVALAPVAHLVAGARRFELDDFGAHVAEQLAAERTRDQLPHLDDPDALQRAPAAHIRHIIPFGTDSDRDGPPRPWLSYT